MVPVLRIEAPPASSLDSELWLVLARVRIVCWSGASPPPLHDRVPGYVLEDMEMKRYVSFEPRTSFLIGAYGTHRFRWCFPTLEAGRRIAHGSGERAAIVKGARSIVVDFRKCIPDLALCPTELRPFGRTCGWCRRQMCQAKFDKFLCRTEGVGKFGSNSRQQGRVGMGVKVLE